MSKDWSKIDMSGEYVAIIDTLAHTGRFLADISTCSGTLWFRSTGILGEQTELSVKFDEVIAGRREELRNGE
jgi:hypothetical protein